VSRGGTSLISGLSLKDLYGKALEVQELFDSVEELTNQIRIETGLRCPPSCRECCRTRGDAIQVAITEFLPLSLKLWNEGRAELFLSTLETVSDDDSCILFESSPELSKEGGCTEYRYRPLLCRMFGFSGVMDKFGKVVPAICRLVKTNCPECVSKLLERIPEGSRIPVFSEFFSRIQGVDPYMGTRTYSINVALRRALEYVGMRFDYTTKGFDRTA